MARTSPPISSNTGTSLSILRVDPNNRVGISKNTEGGITMKATEEVSFTQAYPGMNLGPVTSISNASPAVVTLAGHGLVSGHEIMFTTTGGLPTGLSLNTKYYVKVVDASTYQVSLTENGTSINTSSAGSGTHSAVSLRTGLNGNGILLQTPNLDAQQATQNATIAVGETDATTNKLTIAQSFVSGKTPIFAVHLWKAADTGSFTGTVKVSIQADSSGSPSGVDLASVTDSNATWLARGAGFNLFTMGTPYQTTIGATYWIVITTSTGDSANHPNIGTASAGGYGSGSVKLFNTTDSWVAVATIDLCFDVVTGIAGSNVSARIVKVLWNNNTTQAGTLLIAGREGGSFAAGSAYVNGVYVTLSGAQTTTTTGYAKKVKSPVLWRTVRSVTSKVIGHLAGVGFNGRIFSLDTSFNVWKYTVATGWNQVASAVLSGATAFKVFFVDSRGNMFLGRSDAGGNLYRSTAAGAGATWTSVFTPGTPAFSGFSVMCEDNLGYLYFGDYCDAGGDKKIWRSTDGGATWNDISAGLFSAITINKHIHGMWWDSYRNLLYCTHGDSGAASKIAVSNDHGITWSVWTNSAQATAMAFTQNAIIYSSDQASDRRIYKVSISPSATITDVTGSTPTVCYDWYSDGGYSQYSSNSTTAGIGFSWFADTDESGNVTFRFGTEGVVSTIIASSDEGVTWTVLDENRASSFLFNEFAYVSRYNTTRDGFNYNRDSNRGEFCQWRVYAPGTNLRVNRSSTYVVADGINNSLTEFADYQLRQPGVIQQLDANYGAQATITNRNVAIDKNSYTLGTAVTTAPLRVETWQGTPSGWTNSISGTGVNPAVDSTYAFQGTQSLKFDLGAGPSASTSWIRRTSVDWGRALVDGDEVWLAGAMRISRIDTNRLGICEFGSIRLNVGTATSLPIKVNRFRIFNSTLAANVGYQDTDDSCTVPEAAFFEYKIAIKLAPAATPNGRVQVWHNSGPGTPMRKAIDAIGIATYSTVIPTNLFVGLEGAANFTTAWMGYYKTGLNSDPTLPDEVHMSGTGQSILPNGILT